MLAVVPGGRDASNVSDVLAREGIETRLCADTVEMCAAARRGAGALLLTEEALTEAGFQSLSALLQSQPPWSDLPVLLLAEGGNPTRPGNICIRKLNLTTGVTVLERPLRVFNLVSAVRAALRARRRQYEVRDLLRQRDEMMAELKNRAENLEASRHELLTAKEKISRHAQDLEATVAERTGKLRDMVAQLEAFSYSISHDMRGPLRAMQQYSTILLEDCGSRLEPREREYLNSIARASNRLDRLIQDVLTYSRVSRSSIELVPVDLDKLVRDILSQYPTFQPPRAVVDIEAPLPVVLGHEASLTQCISNLLANAVKFVRPGEQARIHIYPGQKNGRVKVWFADNGIGIAPENHQRIFNIFERVNSESEYEGTGIGLSIVKKTIERMGGDVGLESELGKGSRFWISLPGAMSKS